MQKGDTLWNFITEKSCTDGETPTKIKILSDQSLKVKIKVRNRKTETDMGVPCPYTPSSPFLFCRRKIKGRRTVNK